jgi:RNA 3'-terminal phosphate cyclase (ATP)
MECVHLGFEGLAVDSGSETLSLALSVMTGWPFAWNGFRRRGAPAGFRSDEEKMVALFAEILNATSAGGTMGETELRFELSDRRVGSYRSELGGTESVVPWVQATVVCASLEAGDSEIVLEGSSTRPSRRPSRFSARRGSIS